jgi:hypothetical protein
MQHWNRSSGRYLHPIPPQTIACSAFYEAEFLPNHNIRTSTASQTVTTAPLRLAVRLSMYLGGGPIQSIEVGQIKLTETNVTSTVS